MKLADKIIDLRKKSGWSQEELAEKMNVSRQSVSKWESAMSVPDLKKILMLADIFGVSTDYLLKDDIETTELGGQDFEEGVVKVSMEDVDTYLASKEKVDGIVARAVFMIITSVVPMFLLLGLSTAENSPITSDLARGVGIVIVIMMVAAGVAIIISSERYKKNDEMFEENYFELMYGVESIIKDRADAYMGQYVARLSLSVSMFILGPITVILGALFSGEDSTMLFLVALLIIIIASGVLIIIPTGSKKGAYDRLLGKGDFSPTKRKEVQRGEKLGAFYWPMIVAIYLAYSFITMNWGVSWIIWPVAAVAFPALIGLMGLFDQE